MVEDTRGTEEALPVFANLEIYLIFFISSLYSLFSGTAKLDEAFQWAILTPTTVLSFQLQRPVATISNLMLFTNRAVIVPIPLGWSSAEVASNDGLEYTLRHLASQSNFASFTTKTVCLNEK